MQIIDGYCGTPNIYADDIGEYNISMYGEGDYVLPVGERLGYELVSNNEVKIKDGLFITQGRRGLIKKGSTESCAIENGTQDEKRNDLIIIEYAKDGITQEESHTLKVIKGTPGAEAADPEITTGDIPGGDILHQMPLYRVKLDGLNVTAVEQLFEMGSIAPETVDPMVATEPGFAADAKATGDAIKSQNSNMQSLQTQLENVEDDLDQVSNTANQAFQQASDGKTAIANAINGKGVSASASETFASLASKITNNLYKPPAYLSGTVSFNNVSAGQYSQHVTFSTAFGPIPKVTVATNYPDTSSVSAYNITRNGFDVKLTSTFSGKGYYTVTWTASA